MRELDVREKRMIQAGVEGLMTLLLVFTAFIKSAEVLGYQVKVSYPIIIGALLKITEIAGIGPLEGDDFTAFLIYVIVLTLIFALCVIMTIRAWQGKGKFLYIIGNAIVIFLVLFLKVAIAELNKSLAEGYVVLHLGLGYWIAFILAIVGLVLGILNIRHPWTGRAAGRSTGRPGGGRHISMPDGARAKAKFDEFRSEMKDKTTHHVKRPVWEDDRVSYENGTSRGRTMPSGRSEEADLYRTSGSSRVSGSSYASGSSSRGGESWSTPVSGTPAWKNETLRSAVREDTPGEGSTGTVKVKFHMKNNGDSGVDTEYFHRDEDDELL